MGYTDYGELMRSTLCRAKRPHEIDEMRVSAHFQAGELSSDKIERAVK